MDPSKSSSRRRRNLSLGAEALEARELLTGGAGDTFAIIPGMIAGAGGTATIKFTIDPSHFTVPKKSFTLGIDVVPDPSSSLKPIIGAVNDSRGKVVPQTFHSIYDPRLPHKQVANGQGTSAVLTSIRLASAKPNAPLTYTVVVHAQSKTSGKFLLGFYLPGDANGDGAVNAADTQHVKSIKGTNANSRNYNFQADVNRDGRIDNMDLSYTRMNQGVKTTVTPVVLANLDPASIGGRADRTTTNPSVHFSGTATPGALIRYAETGKKVPNVSATADASGKYSMIVPLGPGVNTFQVTATDPFGQTITGQIAPVTYIATPPVTLASLTAGKSQK